MTSQVNPQPLLSGSSLSPYTKRLTKLVAIADKLKRGENVQSDWYVTHLLQTHYKVDISD